MNILQINNYFSLVGGAEVIAYNTYKLLECNGHNSFFWSTDYKPFIENNYKYQKFFTKYTGGINNYLKNPVRYFYNIQAKRDFKNFIDLIQPDIIHIHSLDFVTSSILPNCKNIPTVYTVHGPNICCPAGSLMFKNSKFCKNLNCRNRMFFSCIINRCAQNSIEASIRRSILLTINSYNYKYIKKFITPSNALRECVLNSNIGIAPNNIITINNFVSNNEIQNIKPNYENKSYFLYVGRLSKEKGIHYLLGAMKDLPKDIEIHIVGTGKEEENLKQYAKENNLDNVKFLGFKNREEIKEEYQNCIATILPCNWFENFPTTNMESFINGKPVIAANIGGIPEQVEDNKTGLLFDPANVEQLKECIMKYWKNPNLVIEHGKNAYQKAKTQYTEERYYNELMKVYEKVLERNRK